MRISLAFPTGIYSGAEQGQAEELPSPSRVYEAFVAACAGGPGASRSNRVLVASKGDRDAVRWLEDNEPLGVIAPPARLNLAAVRRYRWRAGPKDPVDSEFEPRAALAGKVEVFWPEAPANVVASLREIAREVTHVGRADSIVIASVDPLEAAPSGKEMLRIAEGRGPGRVMRIPRRGRFDVLEEAHEVASRPGRHETGRMGKQSPDEMTTGHNTAAVELRRFAATPGPDWPFAEIWEMRIDGASRVRELIARPRYRVAACIAVHRALIRTIGEDVPAFVTGRDGAGPMRGSGHLSIQIDVAPGATQARLLLAIPQEVSDSDRADLLSAVEEPIRVRLGSGRREPSFTFQAPRFRSALAFWPARSRVTRSVVPVVLEATGGPRTGGWTLDDALCCSVGYAMRGVLERHGVKWGAGWAFRQRLVNTLRDDFGVSTRAVRRKESASRFLHRAPEGALIVAVEATVELGDLDMEGRGFIALGRARHLGGGMMRPTEP